MLVMRPGTQDAAQTRIVVTSEGVLEGTLFRTVNSTEMEMMRMVKSTAWTDHWPTKAFAMQFPSAGVFGVPVRPLARIRAPEIVLFKLLIQSR